ncbi:hypothetical protein ON010_g12689 [Phytophthora cinnamomi]|nr:hypothetical protein ON010_g12689 [Phytophthora cinnamomi]
MNQANKGSAGAQSTPVAHNPSQVSPHMQLQQQQNMLLQSPSGPQEGNVYNVGSIPYLGGKVTPLPSTGLFVAQREEHHAQTMIPPLGRQTLSQQYTLSPGALTTDALLASASDGSHSALRSSLSASQDHDKHPEVSKSELVTPPTFVPPPLNSLFHPPVINAAAGTTRTLHHLASSNEGANRPVFPLPAHLPTLLQHESSVAADPPAKDMSGDMAADKDANLALLQMKEEKAERDDLVLQAAGDLPAASDTSVPMDDENMNSFLDSVALELDDIME